MPSLARPATRARRADLAARLLVAAEAEIVASGLSALRARALALQAGCSVGAIYVVFPDLDDLILAVNARTLDGIEAALAPTSTDDAPASPAAHLVHLAGAYLDYAQANRNRWTALFQHRMAERPLPDWYAARRQSAFAAIEAPLARLRPDLPRDDHAALARSLFAAVHGMVALGLDELLGALTLPDLRAQLRTMVAAMAAGLAQPASPAKPRASRPAAT